MTDLTSIETIIKIIIGVIGVISTLGKLKDLFANNKRKQEINTDLDILQKLKNNSELYDSKIETKIKENLQKAYSNKNSDFTDFLWGLSLFIGFGFWTIDLLGNFTDFNPWAILTLGIAFIGLSISFGTNDKEIVEANEQPFYKIGIFEKTNFKFTIIVLIFTTTILPIMVWKISGFSYWYILVFRFWVMSLLKLCKIIRKI